MTLNSARKKAIIVSIAALSAVIICMTIVVIKGGSSVSAKPFVNISNQGAELLNVINTSVDLAQKAQDEYRPIEVKRAFIDSGGCARVIVHNSTQTPITAYDLIIIHFDKQGRPISDNTACTVNDIILSAGQDIGIDKYVGGSEGGAYIKAVIKKALYADGTAWENTDYETEVSLASSYFDTDEYNNSIKKNEVNVQKAAENAHIKINEMTMADVDAISARRDLKLVLTNTSTRTITDIKVAVAEFDKDNKPIDVSPQIYIGKNIRLASCSGMELKVGESRAFSSSGFLEKDCYRINAIITEITFSDGIKWKNPYAIDWLLWFM